MRIITFDDFAMFSCSLIQSFKFGFLFSKYFKLVLSFHAHILPYYLVKNGYFLTSSKHNKYPLLVQLRIFLATPCWMTDTSWGYVSKHYFREGVYSNKAILLRYKLVSQ